MGMQHDPRPEQVPASAAGQEREDGAAPGRRNVPSLAPAAAPAGNCREIHAFSQGNPQAERRTRWVLVLTLVVMCVEIGVGWAVNSMALLADGWHMSSHAVALGLTVFAYRMAARYARDQRFSFGTWKIEVLGGYTSALLLVGVALTMLVESVERLVHPLPIGYDQAIGTALLGLAVNLASAWLLKDDHHHHSHSHGHAHGHTSGHAPVRGTGHAPVQDHAHDHDHDHDHAHGHGHEQSVAAHATHAAHAGHGDLNLRAAYIHVLADAATSVLAIVALFGGKWWGADWLDPLMGVAGAMLVGVWAKGLLRDCARVLLDAEMDGPLVGQVRHTLQEEAPGMTLQDLHLWRVAHDRYACIVALTVPETLAASGPHPLLSPEQLRRRLQARHPDLIHVTVEICRISGGGQRCCA